MVVSTPAAATLLLLLVAVISSAAEALSVGAIGAVVVLVHTSIASHAVGIASVETVALEVAGISAITAHLGVLWWRKAALSSRGIVGRRSRSRTERRRRT